MHLILTLLCRNEADIISSTIDFHLSRGVDLVIATDNGSTDGTREILNNYLSSGRVILIDEPGNNHDQAVWVTRMARIASSQYAADWVIHCDADEFWWPASGDLKKELAEIPAAVDVLSVKRHNFLPPLEAGDNSIPFHQRQTIRERVSLNALGLPLPDKVCHRGHSQISVSDGNHAVVLEGQDLLVARSDRIDILHYPIRSYAQFERKIREGTEALERNRRISPEIGSTWRRLYKEYLQCGRLKEYYDTLISPADLLADSLLQATLIEDQRLQRAFGNE
jgi:glycosyltransferase involved in cell wall biosynthesis